MTRLPVTDGMRAIAVIAVVLFHTFPSLVTGGFVGVDVFFVISGFVITLVYADKLIDRSTRFRAFFIRRVRRLAPAYIVVVAATTVASFIIMLPRDLTNYAWALAFQGIYSQNFAFWMIGDYFEFPLAKPLLHTWSLAVEEQFYFFFPFLILIARVRRSWAVIALALAAAASLAIGLYIAGISPKTSFYMIPMRVWEFACGIATAWLFRRDAIPSKLAPWVANAGLVAILVSFVAFDEKSAFPGWQSFIAVGGSMMLLASQQARTIGTNALRTGLAQYPGRISYSWYLWHWPPLSLWFLATGVPAAGFTALGLGVFGLAAGAASYQYIEKPIAESRRPLQGKHALMIVGLFAAFTLAASAVVFKTDGFVRHYPASTEKLMRAQLDVPPYRCPLTRRLAMWRDEVCRLNDAKAQGGVLLIGDSHADRTKTVLVDLANAAGVPFYLTKRNCRLSDYGSRPDCSSAALLASVRKLGIQKIVAVAHWDLKLTDADRARLASNIKSLGLPVYLQLPTPESAFFSPGFRLSGQVTDRNTRRPDLAYVTNQDGDFRSAMSDIAASDPNVVVMDPLPTLCPSTCLLEVAGHHMYRDDNHLTLPGVEMLKPLYIQIFQGAPQPHTDKRQGHVN
jgi:peptidoglycan/LPS O-acetylase OafA/YrhL